MIEAVLSVIENEAQRNQLADFYSHYKSRLFSIAFSKLHNEAEAEDAVQEAFSRIASKPDTFFNIQLIEKQVAYVDVIVRNIAIDMYNSKNKYVTTDLNENEIYDYDNINLDDKLFENISRNELVNFVDNLPPLQRNVLILTCFVNLSIDETAERLKISKKAANWRLYLARKAIKEFIAERRKDS